MNNLRDESLLKKFGKHLRKLREERELSIRELALEVDVDHSQIFKIEQGKINPTLTTLVAIASGLKITPQELLTY